MRNGCKQARMTGGRPFLARPLPGLLLDPAASPMSCTMSIPHP
ncbi:hypothetical protein MMALV_05170 [Candidatus Methanomethylophilus alvi Mx1201]|uniref:Uncharacterized protein n=1 Tax=Methanomethylophilus alvi (strain Mx1201) TaxID=1236689 RepID=M9SBU0_METAX|nr:hypothetical protein MMALV_05170 [Candidatus Methanomethylophilus alvi Mx1201]